ncbi:MAG TPA: hypothetical protein VFW84_01910 [Aquabacterium sp.]|uniref:hypothetical protein n=1 Tax=Aquabacterium sp. TaxID=1872578 RepID=UPI002E36C460|nr:hypothetical protein [Aquabacterium sp.]HEX5371467.1 hypothetical protein [Aquabacterium sp.]
MTRLLTATVMAVSAMTMSGCALLQSGASGVTLNILEEGFTPPALKLTDADMVCNFATVNAPLVGAARAFHGDPSLMEATLYTTAAVCSDTNALNEELRYMRAVRDKRPDEAQDARIAQKRYLALSTDRQYTAFKRMRDKLEQKYFFKYGKTCPRFKRDFDELTYLAGTLSGLLAITNDMSSQQSVGVPTDIAPLSEFAMTCLDNAKWWGVPQAVRAAVWSLLPGGSEGKDVKGTFENSMALGEAKGVRLSHVLATVAASSADDTATVRQTIKRFANVENFKQNPDYRIFDAIAKMQLQFISDRMWTQATGSRTPFNSLGKFWDDKAAGSDVNTDNFLN